METRQIRDRVGKLVATEEHCENGDIIVKDYKGKILGKYQSGTDSTVDHIGRKIAQGDAHGSLIDL